MARLVDELKRLPGIGAKSAQRIAFYLLRADREQAERLAQALIEVKDRIRLCGRCCNIADGELCRICSDPNRNQKLICVIEEPHNIMIIEKTGQFQGLYHVLHGCLSPLRGVGPEQLKLKGLMERLRDGSIEEIIVATNPTAEGEATAAYLSRLLKPLGVLVTRIGMGLPVGSDLDYVDEVTMRKSIEGRREI